MYAVWAHGLVALLDPPYHQRVARGPGESKQTEGDLVSAKTVETSNLTVELETSDLKSLSQDGLISPMTMELSTTDLIQPGHTKAELGRILGESSSVIVDLADDRAPPPVLAPRAPTNPAPGLSSLMPVANVTPRSIAIPTPADLARRAQTASEEDKPGGVWWIVAIYLACAAALGLSIYVRFFR